MSEQPQANLKALLVAIQLLDKAQALEDSLYELQWGSAMLVVGISGRALVIIAPLFNKLPEGKVLPLFRRLLELNSTLGGVASFALQADGWVVLQSGRDVNGMDAEEFGILLRTVAEHADRYDGMLYQEFFAAETPESDGFADDADGDDAGEATGGEAATGDDAGEAGSDASSRPDSAAPQE